MITDHIIFFKDSRRMRDLPDESVDLVVTSPPYPMIEMWDNVYASQNKKISKLLKNGDGMAAFEMMHQELDKVWNEMYRVVKKGGIVCINVGDATRTIDGCFCLYTNHSRIFSHLQKLGFSALPAILWRKQTNAPNKFMGSGMLPPGAYVTLEHEYVLVLRKGNKKEFRLPGEKKLRRESAFFWEERNVWFSDVWMDLKGASQNLFENKARNRSGAFPFELPYRLISMFSVKTDVVLDPFLGIGTTVYAAMATGRNSVGYETDQGLKELIFSKLENIHEFSNSRIASRFQKHFEFIEERYHKKGAFKHVNQHYGFPVVTAQETDLLINDLKSVERIDENRFRAEHYPGAQKDFVKTWEKYVL